MFINAKSVLNSYQTLYRDMAFEWLGLFRLVAEAYPCREVLYPGSSVHVMPSFVFLIKDNRPGGLLLTNQRDEVGDTPRFELLTAIRFQGGEYRFVSAADASRQEAAKNYLRQAQRGLEYTESETYFLFKKCL